MKLKADHKTVCKFDPRNLRDQDNLKLVQRNIKDLYVDALKRREFSLVRAPNATETELSADKELEDRWNSFKRNRSGLS